MPRQKTTGEREKKKKYKRIERAKERERGRKGRVGKRNEGGNPLQCRERLFIVSSQYDVM